ncbi:MAG: chemotaxis protein CheW [Wolinella sp.]
MDRIEHGLRFLTFFIDDEYYGVEILHVKEIISWVKTTKIPKTPAYVRGVMNLRGNIIPVLDLRLRFSLAPKEPDMHTSIIVVTLDCVSIGLVVDRVAEAISTDEKHLSVTPKFNTKIDSSCISYMIRGDFGIVAILSLEAMFPKEEIDRYENVSV